MYLCEHEISSAYSCRLTGMVCQQKGAKAVVLPVFENCVIVYNQTVCLMQF